ncbi:hypothetical protein D9757_004276 [Collybiopsis confluens]|uniref:FCP1 homology domain-containing protein n=1 Tax=Collybiopsis confluens TaxID=2823264 RepID=A0A8H5HTU5_9AGAR|nr:hypothetical protein D9757_004276 [Collybiopsis confluens]
MTTDRPEPPVPSSAHRPSIRKRLFSSHSRTRKDSRSRWEKAAQHVARPTEQSSGSIKGQEAGASSASPSQEDTDREQASLNTTLSSNHRQLRVPFYRRSKNTKSSASVLDSFPSHSQSKSSISNHKANDPSWPSKKSSTHRPSFLSRVLKVVPCVGSEEHVPMVTKSDTADGPGEIMSEVKETPRSNTDVHNSSNSPPQSLMLPQSTSVETPTQSPPPTDESDIIIPPPPSTQLLPEDETDGVTSGAVQPPGSTGEPLIKSITRDSDDDSDGTHYTDEDVHGGALHQSLLDEQAEEERLIRDGGSGIPIGPDGLPTPLLPPILPAHAGRKCLVLDLDETLVHSSFRPIPSPDYIVPVEIESHWHHFHVLKRPGVDLFLKEMGEIYEIVVFTASLSKYADPVLDQLDISKVVTHRLFRESCFSHKGNYVKDLSQLGRPIADTIILDNSPASYIFHPTNAVPVSSWFNDPHDAELTDLIPFLVDLADMGRVPDVREILDNAR